MTVAGRCLTGHLTGTTAMPEEAGTPQDRWMANDNLVMSFLINSMQPNIGKGYVLMDTATEVWKAAQDTYSQVGNAAQVYELRKKIHDTKQKELTVSQYYADLRECWQELDYYSDYHPTTATDSSAYRKHLDKIRVYDFLAGLNVEYDPIRIQILSKDPLPTLEQSYALVHTEDRRRAAMLSSSVPERSALHTGPVVSTQSSSSAKEAVKCEHCGRLWHTKATCWKLHGKPADFEATRKKGGKGRGAASKANQAVSASSPTTDLSLSPEELQAFRRMLQATSGSTQSTATATTSSTESGNREEDWVW